VTFIFFRKALFKAEIPHGKTILPPVRIEKLLFIVAHKNALLFYFGVCVAWLHIYYTVVAQVYSKMSTTSETQRIHKTYDITSLMQTNASL